jgi:predicted regulator of amino acid metabolism with ACT domain
VLGFGKQRTVSATLDLDTVRETLAYIRDDLQRVSGLENAASALSLAVIEIDRAHRANHPIAQSIIHSRFLKRRRPN